jgi:glucokinase
MTDTTRTAAQSALKEPLLVADIGGTNARFGLWHQDALHFEETLKCSNFPGPAEAAGHYLKAVKGTGVLPAPKRAAFAVAGPLLEDRVALTNNGWDFSAAATRRSLGLEQLVFLNDFTALALAVPRLAHDERRQHGGGAPVADAPIGVIGPGTGLGVSGLLRMQGQWLALQGEGGHVTLPPVDEREIAVVSRLRQRYTHVSAERVLCGDGMELLHRTLAELDALPDPALPASEITKRALDGSDGRCVATLAMFCGWLGNVAGNLALTLGARGGVYIGGGIIPRLGEHLATTPFRSRFESKGRFAGFLASIPVYVITARYPALLGCVQAMANSSPRLEAS